MAATNGSPVLVFGALAAPLVARRRTRETDGRVLLAALRPHPLADADVSGAAAAATAAAGGGVGVGKRRADAGRSGAAVDGRPAPQAAPAAAPRAQLARLQVHRRPVARVRISEFD